MSRTVAVSLSVAVPSPRKVKRKRGNVYENLTVIVFCKVTLLQENIYDFLLVNVFLPILSWILIG